MSLWKSHFRVFNIINGNNRWNKLRGTKQNDLISGKGGSDLLLAKDGNDILNGDTGWDILKGGNGNDQLNGGRGRDLLKGNSGNDTLDGGIHRDALYGGGGEDIFVIADSRTRDRDFIGDFTDDVDKLQLLGSLSYDDLTIEDNYWGDSTLISNNNQTIAVLYNVDATEIDESDFT